MINLKLEDKLNEKQAVCTYLIELVNRKNMLLEKAVSEINILKKQNEQLTKRIMIMKGE